MKGIYDYYMISNYGRVYHRYLNKIMNPGTGSSGYKFIVVATKYGPKILQIHRLVMIYFGPIIYFPENDVNHLDGVKDNNLRSNLEWCTRSDNIKHAYLNNLHPKGENSILSKVNNNMVIKICELLELNKFTEKEIANIIGYPVSESIVAGIKQRKAWTDISCNYSFYHRKRFLVDNDYIEKLCFAFQNNPINNLSINDYCKFCLKLIGLPDSYQYVEMARKIYSKKHYTNISNKYNF